MQPLLLGCHIVVAVCPNFVDAYDPSFCVKSFHHVLHICCRRDEEVAVADKPRSPPTKHSSGSSRENRRSRSPSTGRRGKRSRSRSSSKFTLHAI